jgi:hypothetical protein
MDARAAVKLLVVVIVAALAWKYISPSLKRPPAAATAAATAAVVPLQRSSCVENAAAASETWGSGLHTFVNPPYDVDAWSTFRSGVESKISAAESACTGSESSDKVKAAMTDLRALIGELDTAIRTGGAPQSDLVQRQESIDQSIEQARDLARAGK